MIITKKQLIKIIKEELEGETHAETTGRLRDRGIEGETHAETTGRLKGTDTRMGRMSQEDTNAAKGAAMALLDAAKIMEQAPSHDPASRYAKEVAKQANLIMDMLVKMGT